MALLWETDTIAISPLADSQYPAYGTSFWQYIFPHANISGDGDVHTDMGVASSGTGSTGNNTGASPIVCEVINATAAQQNHLDALDGARASFRGIFRFYTEHAGERHFELHPLTGLYTWNGSAFVLDTDYHSNIVSDPDGTSHSNTTLAAVIDGSQTVTAQIQNDNTKVDFDFPSPSVNYMQLKGVALSAVTSDATSSYFLFRPNIVPTVTLRCRLVANTGAANAAAGLSVNQAVTVNALTRTDMGFVSSQIATMTAGQTATFPRTVELIVLGLPGLAAPSPTPTTTATPTATPTATATATPASTPTATPRTTPSPTPTATATATAAPTATATATSTPTATPVTTPSPTPTATATATSTPIATPTATATSTPTATPITTPSPTATATATASATPTSTPTATPITTPSPNPSATATASPTATAIPTATATSTPTATATVTATATPVATPTATPAAQTVNLSTRMRVQTGDNVGIGGFIIAGTTPKHVLLRAIGPSLTQFGVPNALTDPLLELHGPGGFAAITNDNWRDDPLQALQIEATGIAPTNDLESAIDASLNPGSYTAVVRGAGNTSGVALVEVYDLNQAVPAKLANISTRAFVSTGDDVVIGGFQLGGHTGEDKIIVRGIGPSLIAFGVANALANPTLELRDGNGALVIANNDWQDNPAQAAQLTAAGLAPTNQLESGIAATLPPGAYTALLAGVNNSTGVGLLEIYDGGQ